jgi:hypothetical protein
MVLVKWVKIYLEEAIEDGYNVSKKLYYQLGGIEEEMGKVNKIEVNEHRILVSIQNLSSGEDSYISIPIKSNVLKFHYGGVLKTEINH